MVETNKKWILVLGGNVLDNAGEKEQEVVAQPAEHGQLLKELALDSQRLLSEFRNRVPVHLHKRECRFLCASVETLRAMR